MVQGSGHWRLGDATSQFQPPRLSSLGVVGVDGVEEILQFSLVEDAICKEDNHSYFGVDHLVMSMCRIFSCVVGRGCLL